MGSQNSHDAYGTHAPRMARGLIMPRHAERPPPRDSACCCRPKAGRLSSCCRSPSASARTRPSSPPSTGCCCASCRSRIPTRSSGSDGAAENQMVERLERLRDQRAAAGRRAVQATFSYPMFQHFRSANQTMTDLAGSRPRRHHRHDRRARGNGERAAGDGQLSRLLGVTARMGRTLRRRTTIPRRRPSQR